VCVGMSYANLMNNENNHRVHVKIPTLVYSHLTLNYVYEVGHSCKIAFVNSEMVRRPIK
jgi:hypothetical protein